MISILLILIGAAFYFIPTIVGFHKKSAGGIFVINFFFGWTLVGWVGALVWALNSDDTRRTHINDSLDSVAVNTTSSGNTDNIDKLLKLKSLLDSGALTQAEFEKEKSKILS
jgi:hypothetical protein